MPYPKEILEHGRAILSSRRDNNRHTAALRSMEIAQKLPRATTLLREISGTSARLVMALVNGQNVDETVQNIKEHNLDKQKEFALLLSQNGFAQDYLEPIYTCGICKDNGYVDGEMCKCFSTILKNLMYQRLGVPEHIGKCGFDNFLLNKYPDTTEAGKPNTPRQYMENVFSHIKSYSKTFSLNSQSLLFYGPPGLGKTHLSMAVAKAAIDQGFDVIYVPFHSILSKLEAAKFSRGKDDYGDMIAAVLECDLLVLDDLGTEFTSPFVLSVLYDIINTRLITQRPSIINTNLELGELEGRYTQRISSRLVGSYNAIRFRGNDIRLINKFSKA